MDRLEKDRDDKQKAERKAYGEGEEEKAPAAAEETPKAAAIADDLTFGNFKVEIKRGPPPDSTKVGAGSIAARKAAHAKEEEKLQAQMKTAEEAASKAGKDTPAYKQAISVVAKLNAQIRAARLVLQSQVQFEEQAAKNTGKPGGATTATDISDFHAIIPINDYPQKARWRVTNKETMVQVWVAWYVFAANVRSRCHPSLARGYDWCFRHKQGHLLRGRQGTTYGRPTQVASSCRVQ